MHQMMKQQPSPLVPRSKTFNQIPVYRVDSDARELTAAELDKYKHLIPRDSQRQMPHNSNNRNDGILLRVRGCLRNRGNVGVQANIQSRDYSINHQPQPSNSNTININNSNGTINHADQVILPARAPVHGSSVSRPVPNTAGNSRPRSEPYQRDVASTSSGTQRNLVNGSMPELNRHANPDTGPAQGSSLRSGFNHWMNSGRYIVLIYFVIHNKR